MNKETLSTLILVDDHIVLRDALANLIDTFEGFVCIDKAANGEGLVEIVEKKGKIPDIVLLDLNMQEMDGFTTALWLQKNYPDVKVIVLTMYNSEIPLIRLLQIGVRGFLKKDINPAELERAIFTVAEDGYYYSHQTTAKLANVFQKARQSKASLDKGILTNMEIEFLKLASTDLTYKEIAAQLQLSPSTIDNYREALFEKLDVKSRVGLAIYSIKNGIISF